VRRLPLREGRGQSGLQTLLVQDRRLLSLSYPLLPALGCPQKNGDIQHMHSLTGSFVREELEEILQPKVLVYPISLFLGETTLRLFALKKEEKLMWMAAFKEALNYSNMSDFYTIKVRLSVLAHLSSRKSSGAASLEPSEQRRKRAPESVWPSRS
jgi:hypothetical protein